MKLAKCSSIVDMFQYIEAKDEVLRLIRSIDPLDVKHEVGASGA